MGFDKALLRFGDGSGAAFWMSAMYSMMLLLAPLDGKNSDPYASTGGSGYRSLAMRMLQKRGRALLY